MTQTLYTLTYPDDIPDVSDLTETAMRRYLETEAETWKAFLSRFGEEEQWAILPTQSHGKVSAAQLASSLDRLMDALGEPAQFRSIQHVYGDGLLAFPPPPAASLQGQLILGLANNDRTHAAQCVHLWFISRLGVIFTGETRRVRSAIEYGEKLMTAAYAAEALPFRQVTSQRLAGAVRTAENHAMTLQEEVATAQADYADHKESLLQEQEQRQGEFEKLEERFNAHMRLGKPAELWEDRSKEHAGNAKKALTRFWIGAALAVVVSLGIPLASGDLIANSFAAEFCSQADPSDCKRVFSAKGPLMIAGLLTMMSLLLWGIRLQYRVFLSERHLSLDASQKRAFTETYLALQKDASVGTDNEAIVLASLFRSTQDGIIRDDDGSLDLSAAAILAKQLGKGA